MLLHHLSLRLCAYVLMIIATSIAINTATTTSHAYLYNYEPLVLGAEPIEEAGV